MMILAPLVIQDIIGNCQFMDDLSIEMVIFHGYVELPEGARDFEDGSRFQKAPRVDQAH